MSTPAIAVSNPPHGEADLAQVAPIMSLSPAEVRMKANYPVPEIWLTDDDLETVEAAVAALRAGGLSLVAMDGATVAEVPAPQVVTAFELADGGITLRIGGDSVEIGESAKAVAVYCQPHHEAESAAHARGDSLADAIANRPSGVFMARDSLVGFGHGRRSVAESPESDDVDLAAFVDFYLKDDGGLRRYVVKETDVDFGGLGDLQMARSKENMAMFAAEAESRLEGIPFDRRLVDMVPRKRAMVGQPGGEFAQRRKGLSFATRALTQLLEQISPDLADIRQFDLASRLAFLTRR